VTESAVVLPPVGDGARDVRCSPDSDRIVDMLRGPEADQTAMRAQIGGLYPEKHRTHHLPGGTRIFRVEDEEIVAGQNHHHDCHYSEHLARFHINLKEK